MPIDLNPDLSWLSKVHRPEMLIAGFPVTRPFALPAGVLKPLAGQQEYVIEQDFAVACGAGADVAVRGRVGGDNLVAVVPPADVLVWAAQTFFVTHGLQLVETMSVDALVRRADLPPPVLTRCPRCRGRMREPDAEVLVGAHATMENGTGCVSAPACELCEGMGRIADYSDGYEQVHNITVDWRALQPIVPHLRGDVVALCLAPSLEGLGFDCHLRPYVEQGGKKTVGGDWRIAWHAVPAARAAVAA